MGAEVERTEKEEQGEATGAMLLEMEGKEVDEVEEILGYRFRDRSLVSEALTHGSFYLPLKAGISYERLEFMGDAVLSCLVAREVFSSYPALSPGPLTRLRAANVDTEKLARIAVARGLHRHLRHKAPYLQGQIQDFMDMMEEYPIHSNGLLDPPKVLADIVESLLGAIFMDSNSSLEIVWKVFKRLGEPLISLETLGKHPMSELHELCQKKKMQLTFLKDTWSENTPVDVLVNGMLLGRACGNRKEIAVNRAAKVALDKLKEEFGDTPDLTTQPSPLPTELLSNTRL